MTIKTAAIYISMICVITLSACSKTDTSKTTEEVAVSQECQDYLAMIEKLAKNDDALKQEFEGLTFESVEQEWQTLTIEERQTFSKDCKQMLELFTKMQELEAKQNK